MKKICFMIMVVFFATTLSMNAQLVSVNAYPSFAGVNSAVVDAVPVYNIPETIIRNGYVRYGINSVLENVTPIFSLNPNQTWPMGLIGLSPGTFYVFQVVVSDTIFSPIGNLTTGQCPIVADIMIQWISCTAPMAASLMDPSLSYQWYINGSQIPGATAVTYTAITSGDYSVKISSNECSSTSQHVQISLSKLSLQILAPSSICEGQNAGVNAFGANTYQWKPLALFNEPNSPNTWVNPQVTTTIKLVGTSGDCIDSLEKVITVLPIPKNVSIAFQESVCKDSPSIILTGSPTGGNFYGQGVFGNTFDPREVIVGHYGLTYNYVNEQGCGVSVMKDIEVTDKALVTKMFLNGNLFFLEGYFPSKIRITIDTLTYITDEGFQDEGQAIFKNVKIKNGDWVIVQSISGDGCLTTKQFQYGLGVEDSEKDKVKIYPNPFQDVLHVELPDGNYHIVVVDMFGKTIQQKETAGNFSIEKGNMKAGCYILRISSENNTKLYKIYVAQ